MESTLMILSVSATKSAHHDRLTKVTITDAQFARDYVLPATTDGLRATDTMSREDVPQQ